MGIFDKRSDTEKEIDRYNRNKANDSASSNYSDSRYRRDDYNSTSANGSYGSSNYNVNSNLYRDNNYPENNNAMPNNYNGIPNNHNSYNPNNGMPNNYNGYNPNNNGMPNNYNGYNPNNNGMPNNYNGYNPNNGMPNGYNTGYRHNYYQNNGYGMMNNPLNHDNPNRVYVKPAKSGNIFTIIFFILFLFIMFSPFLLSKFFYSVDAITLIMPIMFLSLFSLLGISVAVVPFITAVIKKRRCKIPLKAVVVDMRSRRGSKGRRLYAPVYQYFYGGKEYIATAGTYRNYALPDIGDEINMLINETNPEDFYVDDTRANLTTLVIGLIFALFPIIMIFSTK